VPWEEYFARLEEIALPDVHLGLDAGDELADLYPGTLVELQEVEG
jgi:hypothetical protein